MSASAQTLSNEFLDRCGYIYGRFCDVLNRFRNSRSGAILIEFAFSVPVFLALIYYIHDVPRVQRIHRKIDFCSKVFIQMVQTISKNRASNNQKVTLSDLNKIICISALPYFGSGTDQYEDSSGIYRYKYGFFPHPIIFFVRGTGENKAKIVWAVKTNWFPVGGATAVQRSRGDFDSHTPVGKRGIFNREYDASAIWPKLKIKKDECKIILDYHFFHDTNISYTNGTGVPRELPASTWGLLIHRPAKSVAWGYFTHIQIFTPQPGLFDDTPPQ